MFGNGTWSARARVVLLIACAVSSAWAQEQPLDPFAAFSAQAQQDDFSLSPNGHDLAWRQRNGGSVEVLIYDVASRTMLRTLSVDPSLTVNGLQWEDDDVLLVEAAGVEPDADGRPFEAERVLAVNTASGKSRLLLTSSREVSMVSNARLLLWDIPGRPHTVLMSSNALFAGGNSSGAGTRGDSGWTLTLFAVDTRTGEGTPIAAGDGLTYQWVVDADGNPVARAEWWGSEHRYSILSRDGTAWRRIYQRSDGVRPLLWGLGAGGKAILATISDHAGRALWSIPLDGSPPKEVLSAEGALAIGFTAYSHKLSFIRTTGPGPRTIWSDPAARVRYESVAHAFPGLEVRITGYSRRGNEVLAEVEGPASPAIYYLINFTTHRADIAGEAYPQLAHVPLGKVETVSYRTRDGQTVDATLTLPANATSGKLPLVVLAPGGIERGDPMAFDWLAQFLTVRGYAVLRPLILPKGVYGIGQTNGSMVTWGGTSQRYAIDGVNFLIKRGVADPKRVCIVGMGYGGYAALAGVAFSPHEYACAVSIDGISDLPAYLDYEEKEFGGRRSDHEALAYWSAEVGSPLDPTVAAQSPVNAAQQVGAPVLLLYTSNDVDVPVTQMEEMDRALVKRGKPVTFIRLGAHSSLERAATRARVLEDIDAFLGENLR